MSIVQLSPKNGVQSQGSSGNLALTPVASPASPISQK
jgi:hypothetical protein